MKFIDQRLVSFFSLSSNVHQSQLIRMRSRSSLVSDFSRTLSFYGLGFRGLFFKDLFVKVRAVSHNEKFEIDHFWTVGMHVRLIRE